MTTFNDRREWNYGLADYDRTHIFAANYLWDLPGDKLDNGFLRAVLGGWQVSGITRFQSGAPLSLVTRNALRTGCSLPSAPCAATTANNFGTDITGGGDGWRAVLIGNPKLPRKRAHRRPVVRHRRSSRRPRSRSRSPTWRECSAVLAARKRRTSTFARGPGMNNTDLALFKNIKLTGTVKAQLRIEAYNVFNHTQFDCDVNTNAAVGSVGSADEPGLRQGHEHTRSAHRAARVRLKF